MNGVKATNVGRSEMPAPRTIASAWDDVGARVPLVEQREDLVGQRLDRRHHEHAAQRRQLGEDRALGDDVLDLGREAERDVRVRGVQAARRRQRVLRAVEEVGIAERDVARAGGDLPARVLEHDVDRHREEPAVIDRRDRAVAAQVLAAARRLDVAGDAPLVTDEQARVAIERRQHGAIGNQKRQAMQRVAASASGAATGARARLQAPRERDQILLAFAAEDRVGERARAPPPSSDGPLQQRAIERRIEAEEADVRLRR